VSAKARTELHPDDRVVQRLFKHVNAISPARGKRDKQVTLPPFDVKYPNLEADRAVGGRKRGHNLLHWRCGPGREVDVLRRALHQTVRLDRISPGHRQPVPGADRQCRVHQGLVVAVKHGRPTNPVSVPGSAPAMSRGVAAAGAACSSHR
jgi:hypothetical protein